jgi:hypothetical protein
LRDGRIAAEPSARQVNVTKRYLIAAAAHNLGRILRRLTGIGKPKALQGGAGGLVALGQGLVARLRNAWVRVTNRVARIIAAFRDDDDRGHGRIAV